MKKIFFISLFVAMCLACVVCTSCSGGGGGGSVASNANSGTWKLSKIDLEYKSGDYNLRTTQEYNWSSKKFTQKSTVKIGTDEQYSDAQTIDMSPVVDAWKVYEDAYGWSYPFKLTLNGDGSVFNYSGNGVTYKVTWKMQGNNLELTETASDGTQSYKGVMTIPYKMSDSELVLEFSKIKFEASSGGQSASVDYSTLLQGYTQNWHYTR